MNATPRARRLRASRQACVGVAFGLVIAAACATSRAAASPQSSAPGVAGPAESVESAESPLVRAHDAVVGLRVGVATGLDRIGSGVVIAPGRLVLTIGYLIEDCGSVQVTTQDNRTVPAVPIAFDAASGLGLLRPLVPLRGVAPAPLGRPDDLKPGDPVMAVTGAVEDGEEGEIALLLVASKRPFVVEDGPRMDAALFTSPPLGNPSGAPLFNRQGELVGIGSIQVPDTLGGSSFLPGNLFVPADAIRAMLARVGGGSGR
jgi:S1-C subfamily serine protease